jgi:pimeloyl-ACP methyl ester carboxylesterase
MTEKRVSATLAALSSTAAIVFAAVCGAGASTDSQGRGAYADVNGIRMYYESYGPSNGMPLVLLHGGGSTIDASFGRILPFFKRRVIAVEEQAHGRSGDRNAPVTFETSADDMAKLLVQLKIGQADLFGFSNGASVALQIAIRHPRAVHKLVFASSITKKDGAVPELWTHIRDASFDNMPQVLKDAFLKVNPDPVKLRNMHEKDLERMRNFTDVPDADLRAIRAPTLILTGDRDIVKLEHAVELTHLIPNSRLLVLAGGHGEYMGEVTVPQQGTRAAERTAEMIGEFLDAP